MRMMRTDLYRYNIQLIIKSIYASIVSQLLEEPPHSSPSHVGKDHEPPASDAGEKAIHLCEFKLLKCLAHPGGWEQSWQAPVEDAEEIAEAAAKAKKKAPCSTSACKGDGVLF